MGARQYEEEPPISYNTRIVKSETYLYDAVIQHYFRKKHYGIRLIAGTISPHRFLSFTIDFSVIYDSHVSLD